LQYLEDFKAGQTFSSDVASVDAAAIKRFAAEFDPQQFHLDEGLAKASFFRGLAASGWHTAALTMQLLVTSDFRPAGGVVGASVDELRWLAPVRPGDTLRLESELIEVRLSTSRPTQGTVKLKATTYNQRNEAVQVLVANLIVPRRNT
jgi:acyl dehydratase